MGNSPSRSCGKIAIEATGLGERAARARSHDAIQRNGRSVRHFWTRWFNLGEEAAALSRRWLGRLCCPPCRHVQTRRDDVDVLRFVLFCFFYTKNAEEERERSCRLITALAFGFPLS